MTTTAAILGAGAGGLAATVELTLAGVDVRLWNRNPSRLEPHRDAGIRHSGAFGDGQVRPATMTSDLADALIGADVVVVCLPSVVHAQLFADLAKLRCTQPIILNPGHTGGALHLRQVFGTSGTALPPIVEFSTLTYIGRVEGGEVSIGGRAKRVTAGALPGGEGALEIAAQLFPGVVAAPDVLASSLANVNLVLHPPGAVLSAAWVEATGGDFTFYVDGMTPAVVRVIEAYDAERLAVAAAFDHHLPTLMEEMTALGSVDAAAAARGDVRDAIRKGVANSTIKAPDSLSHRYYQEDFGFGVLPFVELARIAGVPVPVADALLRMGDTLTGDDFMTRGLTARRLGIEGLDLAGLLAIVRS